MAFTNTVTLSLVKIWKHIQVNLSFRYSFRFVENLIFRIFWCYGDFGRGIFMLLIQIWRLKKSEWAHFRIQRNKFRMSGLPYWPISFQGKLKSSHFFLFSSKYASHFVYVCRFQSVYKIWDGVKLNIEMISVRVSMRKLLGCAILPGIRFRQLIKT